MNYRSYSVSRENGRFVAFDPNESEIIFKIFSRDLKRLKNGIDALWLPCVGKSAQLMDESSAPRWRREWARNPVGEVDLDAENARGAC